MSSVISGNMIGSYSQIGKTFTLVDEDGNELTGIVVDRMTIFDATDNDVREGMVYASGSGVSTGTKIIPVYYAGYGCKIISANSAVTISTPEYDYDDILIVISRYNTTTANSVVSTFTSIDNSMYAVGNSVKVSDIVVDMNNKKINLGIVSSEKSVVRYFVIREEY